MPGTVSGTLTDAATSREGESGLENIGGAPPESTQEPSGAEAASPAVLPAMGVELFALYDWALMINSDV